MSSVYESRFWLKNLDWNTPANLSYPKYPAYGLLRNASVFQPQKAATWFYGAEITYNELYLMVTRMANVLVEQGIKKGDRVGILLPNCPQFVIAYWAILMAGGIIVNLNPQYTIEELRFLFQDSDLSGLFTFDAILPVVKPLTKEMNISTVIVTKLSDFMPNIPVSTPEELGLEKGWLHLSQALQTDKIWAPPFVDIMPEDPAVIQYTGGTTGIPKGAVLTQYNLVAASIAVVRWAGSYNDAQPYERRRTLCIVPYCHIYGETCCIGHSTFCGATQVLLPKFDINEVFDTLHKFEHFSFWPAVPTMLQAVFNSPRVSEIDWHQKIGWTCSGAAPASIELINKCRSYDFNFNEAFGMSETTCLGIASPGNGRDKPMSVGIPYVDVTVRLVGEEGNDVPLNEPGEIWIKCPFVMKEYWRRPEDTANAITEDGWLKTGDVAYMDDDGYIFIVDRIKDMIIAGGFNIYPREVDEALLKHPKVFDVITIGIPDEYHGEIIKAYVQLKPGMTATEKEIIEFCQTQLVKYKVPRIIEFREELPRTGVGKALRRILRDEEIEKMKQKG